MKDRDRWIANDRKIAQLDPRYQARFEGVVKRLESAGWKPLIAEARRSLVRQALLRARGLSKVWKGKHQTGHAMDVISHDYPWEDTPLGYMVELAYAARDEGLGTGLLWDMKPLDRAAAEYKLFHGTRAELIHLLTYVGRGFDPCHVEVRS